MTRFHDFTTEELAYIGTGLAMAGRELESEKAVLPLLSELNRELSERPKRE
jgi:hypothetical protein